MNVFGQLRSLVYLRRAARALESIADSQCELVRIERERTPGYKPPRPTVFDVASVADFNKRYRTEHPELEDADAPV